MKPEFPRIIFTDHEFVDATEFGRRGRFFNSLIELYLDNFKKRPREWIIMDNEDFKALLKKVESKS